MNLGKSILTLVGGEMNVKNVAHCATRLRFTLIDEGKAQQKEIEGLDGVISVVRKGGQFQVVIGTNVGSIYNEVIAGTNFGTRDEADDGAEKKVMGALLMPEFTNLMGEAGNGTVVSFIGIPIVMMTYSSTVIPAVLSIYIYSKLEKLLNKIIPTAVQLCFVPLISLLLMVPLTAGVVGPLGVYLGNGIASIVNTLINFNGWIAGAVVGGCWNILVVFGIHWAVNPVMIQNIGVMGYDYIVPLTAATNFGMAGATFGTFLKTKDQKMKQFSMSALLSIFFAGITEPAIYGVGVILYMQLVLSPMMG